MKYEQFSKIYNALKQISAEEQISANNSLSQGDIIKKIKEKLSPDSDAYKEWEKGNFRLDHVFITTDDCLEKQSTLLVRAFESEDLKVVDLLIKVGTNVNAVGKNELTPLIIAIEKECKYSKYKELVDLLMKASTDVDTAGGVDEKTPIAVAVEFGNLRVFNALIKAGANVSIKRCGMPLLEWAENNERCLGNKEDMKAIINTLKGSSEGKVQTDPKIATTPANSSETSSAPTAGNTNPEKNDTTFWSEHKGKISLGVVGLCVAGAIAAYVLAYPVVALALAVLAAVILMGAGIAKVREKVENPSIEKPFTQKEKAA